MAVRKKIFNIIRQRKFSGPTRLKFDCRRECRDVSLEPILCVELLIVTKIEKHGSVHQHRVVNEMRAYAKNTALEWTKLGT